MIYWLGRAVNHSLITSLLGPGRRWLIMPVVVDYRYCDGVQDCPAVRICDAGALFFNSSTGRVEYDQEKCRNCGTCAHYCGYGAVMHVATDEERQMLLELIKRAD